MNKKTNGLYIALFICSTLVLTMVFSINNADLKSIILGIGTGGLTSTLVAYLIERRDNEWLEKEKQARRKVIIQEYADIYKRLAHCY